MYSEIPEKYIDIPRRRLFRLVVGNGLLMFAGQVVFFNIFACISFFIWVLGALRVIRNICPLWKSCGYSVKLYAVMYAVLFAAGFYPAWIVRGFLFSVM